MKVQRLLLLAGLLIIGLAIVACGSATEEVTEDSITREELDTALQQAIAAAAQPAPAPAPAPAGPSADELRALVSEAVVGSVPEGTSAEEIASMVEAAVEAATAGAVTTADIDRSVAKAVEDAVSGGPTPLSSAEVEAIVAAAVAAIPTPEPIMVPAPAPVDVDVEMARMGGTLRAVPHGSLKSLDAQWTTVTVTANVRHHLQEGLFTLDDNLALQPQLAESWQSSPELLDDDRQAAGWPGVPLWGDSEGW